MVFKKFFLLMIKTFWYFSLKLYQNGITILIKYLYVQHFQLVIIKHLSIISCRSLVTAQIHFCWNCQGVFRSRNKNLFVLFCTDYHTDSRDAPWCSDFCRTLEDFTSCSTLLLPLFYDIWYFKNSIQCIIMSKHIQTLFSLNYGCSFLV